MLSLFPPSLQQQLQAQHLSQHAQGLPVGPHPSGLPHPSLALGGGSGLLALSGALGAQLAAKDERAHLEAVAAASAAAAELHRGAVTLEMMHSFPFFVCLFVSSSPKCQIVGEVSAGTGPRQQFEDIMLR